MSTRAAFLRNEAEQLLASLTGADRMYCRRFLDAVLEIAKEEAGELQNPGRPTLDQPLSE